MALSDFTPQALTALGGAGILVYLAKIVLGDRAVDRPLQRALAALQKRLDAERARTAEQEREIASLNDDRNAARSAASDAADRMRSAESALADLQQRLGRAEKDRAEQARTIAELRQENSRLRNGSTP